MATTTQTWKETFTKKYKDLGFDYFGWFDAKYEIIFKKKSSDDLSTIWFNAYVKLDGQLKEKYEFESYRIKNIIGCDTSEFGSNPDLAQLSILRSRITSIINEHYEK